jgi:hypothetical protein
MVHVFSRDFLAADLSPYYSGEEMVETSALLLRALFDW